MNNKSKPRTGTELSRNLTWEKNKKSTSKEYVEDGENLDSMKMDKVLLLLLHCRYHGDSNQSKLAEYSALKHHQSLSRLSHQPFAPYLWYHHLFHRKENLTKSMILWPTQTKHRRNVTILQVQVWRYDNNELRVKMSNNQQYTSNLKFRSREFKMAINLNQEYKDKITDSIYQ